MTDWYMKNLSLIRQRDVMLYYRLLEMVEPKYKADWSVIDDMISPKEWLFGAGWFDSDATVLMYGFGNGEYVMSVLDRLNEKGHLILMVPDMPEFLAMLHMTDMEELLSDTRLFIVVFGENNDILLRYIAGCFLPETIDEAKLLVLPEYDVIYPEGITFMEQALAIMVQWMKG